MNDCSAKEVTVLITPRDRYSGALTNIKRLYEHTDEALFDLIVVDLGYPKKQILEIGRYLSSKPNAQIVNSGKVIPFEALRNIREQIETPYTALVDNDSHVTEGWLEPLLQAAKEHDAAVVSPVTLETSGVDDGAALRNHLFTTEIRVVDVEETPYLVEYKTYRRANPDDLPTEVTPTEAFELHGVLFNTKDLQEIEIPQMTIREHLDIGMQLINKGRPVITQPKSIIIFDNLSTRATLSDLEFFNRRWNAEITQKSSDLFKKRWGYAFYSEPAIYNWALRRRIFLVLRWMHIPTPLANKIDRVIGAIRRRLSPIWDPMPNAESSSVSLFKQLGNKFPTQLSKTEFI